MDSEMLQTFKEDLIRRRNELRDSMQNELNELRDEEGHHLADMEDLASDSRDETVTFEVLALEQSGLQQIEEALEAIEEGNYGECEECEETINIERLKALPFATLCIDCKREEERLG